MIDRPQSVPQLSYDQTLQFSKTFNLNRNAIVSQSINAVLPLENPLNVICIQMHVLALDCTTVVVSGKVGPVKPVNHTSWVAVVIPTDRPKSVRNRCLIELFCGVVCVVTLPF